ncbi:MAG: hypothetical protein R3Y38_02725 [Rikenellaceae bacterium]
MGAAQDACLTEIIQSIVSSVSVNISSEQSLSVNETTVNDKSDIVSVYDSKIKTLAAQLPYIQGVTLQKAEMYWVKSLIKSSKQTIYTCHIRYPFSTVERNKLIAEFKAQDDAQMRKYETIVASLDKFTEVEYISRAVADLTQLYEYFFDDLRKNQVQALQSKYTAEYKKIRIIPTDQQFGKASYYLAIGDRRVTTSLRPLLKSEQATNLKVDVDPQGECLLSYNADYAMDDVENRVDVTYMFMGNALKYSFFFDIKQNNFEVYPFSQVEVVMLDGGKLAKISMNIRSRYKGDFIVNKVSLKIQGVSMQIDKAINQKFSGSKDHLLEFEVSENLSPSKNLSSLCSGMLEIQQVDPNKKHEIKVLLPYKVSN